MESIVLATPFALVVLCPGLTAPSPCATLQVTTTPATGCPPGSSAATLSETGSGLLKYQLCASPAVFTRSLGGRGWVVSPLQAHADTPASRVITRFVVMAVRMTLGSGSASTRSPRPLLSARPSRRHPCRREWCNG